MPSVGKAGGKQGQQDDLLLVPCGHGGSCMLFSLLLVGFFVLMKQKSVSLYKVTT